MNLSLGPDIQKIIEERVRSGKFATAEDVVSAAVRNLALRDQFGDFAPGELDRIIAEGEQSIQEEGTLDGDDAFQKRQERLKASDLRR